MTTKRRLKRTYVWARNSQDALKQNSELFAVEIYHSNVR
jgi:hypothetical protein